jgi:ferrous iron transport protein B
LLSGVLAKEVVVGTLNTLYSQLGGDSAVLIDQYAGLFNGLLAAVRTIPENISSLLSALWNPIVASAPGDTMAQSIMGQMYQRFDGKTGAFAYLLFVLLYFPCVSTTAAMARELGQRWAWFSVAWTTLVAYSFAVFFYQLFTFSRHPISASGWLAGIVITYIVLILGLRYFSARESSAVDVPVCAKAALYRKRCL